MEITIFISIIALLISLLNFFIAYKNSSIELDVEIDNKIYKTYDIFGFKNGIPDKNQSYGKAIVSNFKVINTSSKNVSIYNMNLLVDGKPVNLIGELNSSYDSLAYFGPRIFDFPYFPIEKDNKFKCSHLCEAYSFNDLSVGILIEPKYQETDNREDFLIDIKNHMFTLTFNVSTKNFISFIPFLSKYAKIKYFEYTYKPEEISDVPPDNINIKTINRII